MKNVYIKILAIVVIPVAANLYALTKLEPILAAVEDQDVAQSYRVFAEQVEAGALDHAEIGQRILRIADGEQKVAEGLGLLRTGGYLWLLGVLLMAVAQSVLILLLIRTQKRLQQRGSEFHAAPAEHS